jgi:hypothetical protein
MNIRGWWERMQGARRKRLLAKRRRAGRDAAPAPRQLPRPAPSPDDPIQARVDLVRFAAFAEAAAESMEAGPPEYTRVRFDEACLYFGRAMEAAKRAGLNQEYARLKLRMTSLRRLYETLRRASRKSETKSPRSDRSPDF